MTTEMTLPAYTRHHWAKSDRKYPSRIHLLEHHLADVGACFEAVLQQPTIRRRLASAARLDDLDNATVARLCLWDWGEVVPISSASGSFDVALEWISKIALFAYSKGCQYPSVIILYFLRQAD